MDAGVIAVIDSMTALVIAFASAIVSNFWEVFLSIGFMVAVAFWIKRKARV